jgi:hypothetical protein
MALADDLLLEAHAIIDELGQSAVLRRTTEGVIDANNPTKGFAKTITDYNVKIAVTEYEEDYVKFQIVEYGDKKAYLSLSGLTVTPSIHSDVIVIGSEIWEIVNVNFLSVNGIHVVAVLQLRR